MLNITLHSFDNWHYRGTVTILNLSRISPLSQTYSNNLQSTWNIFETQISWFSDLCIFISKTYISLRTPKYNRFSETTGVGRYTLLLLCGFTAAYRAERILSLVISVIFISFTEWYVYIFTRFLGRQLKKTRQFYLLYLNGSVDWKVNTDWHLYG